MHSNELERLNQKMTSLKEELDLTEKVIKKPYDVFISYARDDYRKVYEQNGETIEEVYPIEENPILQITKALDEQGFNYWYDQKGISATFIKSIKQKIDASKLMIFVSSYNSNYKSHWTPDEISYAKGKKPKMPIIVFYIDGEELNEEFSLALASLQQISDYPHNPTKGLNELIKCVKESLVEITTKRDKLNEEIESIQREIDDIKQEIANEQERISLRADYDKLVAEVAAIEASANSKRMDIIGKLHKLQFDDLRKEYLDTLNRSGILHQREIEAKTETSRKKKQLFLVSLISTAIFIVLLIVIGFMYVNTSKIRGEKDILLKQNDSIAIENENLENKNIELQKQLGAPYIKVNKTDKNLQLTSAAGTKKITIDSNADWEPIAPQDAFYQLKAQGNNLIINHEANTTAGARTSNFKVALKQDNSVSEQIKLTQAATPDTIILKYIKHNADYNGIEIKLYVQVNYIDGNLEVFADYYDENTNRVYAIEDKGYYYEYDITGEPFLSSKIQTIECNNELKDIRIFVPKSAYRSAPTKAKVVFRHDKKIIKTCYVAL